MFGRSVGMLERMGAKAKKGTKKTPRAPETERAMVAWTALHVHPPRVRSSHECMVVEPPPVERPTSSRAVTKRPPSDRPREEEEEGQLVRPKRKKEVSLGQSIAGALMVDAPIAAKPLSERPPPSTFDPRKESEFTDAGNSRGEPYFGRDQIKAKSRETALLNDRHSSKLSGIYQNLRINIPSRRVLRDRPGCPPMVTDFLSSQTPRSNVEVPICVTRAINNLPRAWTTDLNEASNRRGDDATQALFALTLQAATMDATVARESELRPSVKKLQADLAESRKKCGEFCDRLSKMEKDSTDAAEKASL
ncbi:hypothetical protein OROHE_012486 [Orobanche hederae]